MNLSKSLRIAFAQQGIKHKLLAQQLGVSNQQISNWLATGQIKQAYLVPIAEFFGMTVSEFIALGED